MNAGWALALAVATCSPAPEPSGWRRDVEGAGHGLEAWEKERRPAYKEQIAEGLSRHLRAP